MNECEIIIEEALKEGRSFLSIIEAQKICNLHKIPTPLSFLTLNIEESFTKVKRIGFPVVLKVISPQIIHKSDKGGVILNIKNEEELETKYKQLVLNLKKQDSVEIKGILIEKMMNPSTEIIIGGLRDLQFGPVVMFGIGGIFAEIYDDVAFGIAPIDRIDAINIINGLKGSKILKGIRGRSPANLDLIIDILIKVSNLMVEHNMIHQLDLNPVIVYPDSVCAVDSRIIIR